MSREKGQSKKRQRDLNKGPMTAAHFGFVPRRGKWLKEEEAFAEDIIRDFREGLLPLEDGVTLRFFLCNLLKCEPMRISKKFSGSGQVGKQLFKACPGNWENKLISLKNLATLELAFLRKLEEQSRKSKSVKHTPFAPYFSLTSTMDLLLEKADVTPTQARNIQGGIMNQNTEQLSAAESTCGTPPSSKPSVLRNAMNNQQKRRSNPVNIVMQHADEHYTQQYQRHGTLLQPVATHHPHKRQKTSRDFNTTVSPPPLSNTPPSAGFASNKKFRLNDEDDLSKSPSSVMMVNAYKHAPTTSSLDQHQLELLEKQQNTAAVRSRSESASSVRHHWDLCFHGAKNKKRGERGNSISKRNATVTDVPVAPSNNAITDGRMQLESISTSMDVRGPTSSFEELIPTYPMEDVDGCSQNFDFNFTNFNFNFSDDFPVFDESSRIPHETVMMTEDFRMIDICS